MSVFIQDEESVVDVEMAGKMMLQDILRMEEPRRTHYIKAWVDAGQYDEAGGKVKLRTHDGKKLEVPYGEGKTMTFPFTGKLVSRLAALRLLRDYGENGFYYGRDQATGMARAEYEALQHREPAIAAQYAKQKLNFIESYLLQVPFSETEEGEDEAAE